MNAKNWIRTLRPAVALAVVCASGCSWRSPSVEFYTMSPMIEGGTEPAARDLALAVGPATFPAFLQRPQIVTRSGENGLVYDDYHRWGGSFEADFLSVLGENLAVLMRTDHVAVYPVEATFPIAYRVVLAVQQFDGRPGDAVTLRVRWTVSPGAGGAALAVRSSTIRVPVPSADHAGLVAAHSAAVAALSREIAAAIAALSAPAH